MAKVWARLETTATSKQELFINDKSKSIAVLAPRRTGKTYGSALRLLKRCLLFPESSVVWLSMTLRNARTVVWPILMEMNDKYEIGAHVHHTDMIMTLPNGSRLMLFSLETESDVHKLRGLYADEAVVDEAQQSKKHILEVAIDRVIRPLLMDRNGVLILIGTPSPVLTGYFYEATGPDATKIGEDGQSKSCLHEKLGVAKHQFIWSLHRWQLADNTALRFDDGRNLADAAADIKKLSGWTDENPVWRREYLGQWVPDDSNSVYKYNPVNNSWHSPGPLKTPELDGLSKWHYIIGIDLGARDPCTLQVLGYNEYHPSYYQIFEHSFPPKTPFSTIAAMLKSILDNYGAEEVVTGGEDSLGEMILLEFKNVYGILIKKLPRRDKRDLIEILNGDFIDGVCYLMSGSALSEEMIYLSWDETGMKEKTSQPNHHCDAFLYASAMSRHRSYTKPEIDTRDRVQKDLDNMIKEMDEKYIVDEDGVSPWRDRDSW